MIQIISDNNAFDGFLNIKKAMNRTLYHGTTIDNAKQIIEQGLFPQVGNFTNEMYDYSEEGLTAEELIFAADKEKVSNAVTAMVNQISHILGKGMHDVTDLDVLRYGALVVIKEADWEQRPDVDWNDRQQVDSNNAWEMSHQEGYHHVEPGDYYSERHEPISFVLQGNKMLSVLKSLGVWPRDWGPDEKQNKKKLLIQYVKAKHREIPMERIVERINGFDAKEFNKWYDIYVRN